MSKLQQNIKKYIWLVHVGTVMTGLFVYTAGRLLLNDSELLASFLLLLIPLLIILLIMLNVDIIARTKGKGHKLLAMLAIIINLLLGLQVGFMFIAQGIGG